MKKNSIGKIIIRVVIGIVIALVAVAVIGYAVVKLYIVPKYAKKLTESGHQEIAEILESNANLGSVPAIGSILKDENVMNLIKDIDGQTARSLLDVMNILDEETANEEGTTAEEKNGNGTVSSDDSPAKSGAVDKQSDADNSNATYDNKFAVTDIIGGVDKSTQNNKPNSSGKDNKINKTTIEPKKGNNTAKGSSNTSGKNTTKGSAESSSKNETESKKGTAYERIAEVATADEMADGLSIIAKVNTSYVLSLTSNGLTGAEKTELLKYIRSVLSSAEISRAVQLYRKYSKYL